MRCDEWMVRKSEWFGIREDLYYILTLLYALGMQTIARLLGSSDPFIFYFPLNLIGANHGLHTSSGVQISLLIVVLRLVVGLRSTLKDARGLEIRQASLLGVEPWCFV